MGNAEAMVTARMGVGKKEEGNRVLASLGTNASKAVNQLYDYVIERGALPFDDRVEERRPRSRADFERSTIPVYDCAEFFARLKDAHGLVYEEIDW